METKGVLFRRIFVSLLLVFTALVVFAQDSGNAKKHVGWRYTKSGGTLIYGDAIGAPDTTDVFVLTDRYFVVITGVKISKWGKSYRLIVLPGRELDHEKRAKEGGSNSTNSKSREPNKFDFGRAFWIEVPNVEHVLENDFKKAYLYSRFSIGALAVPFKYRFDYSSRNAQIAGEASLGLSVSFDLYRDSGFEERFSLIFSAGLTTINPNSAFDDSIIEKTKNIPGFTFCGGLVGRIKNTELGILYGYDFADKDWVFDRKPWVSLAVGFSFYNPEKEKGNNSR